MPALSAGRGTARASASTGSGFTFQAAKDSLAYRNPRLRRANVHLENEEFDEAERILGRYITQYPRDPEALASLAIALAAGRGRLQSAEKAARKALAVAPKAVAGHFALGYVYLLGSRLEPGFRYLMKARDLDPRDPRVNFGLRCFDEMQAPVISDLSAGNRVNRALARCRGTILRQRRAALVLAAMLTALGAIAACTGLPG